MTHPEPPAGAEELRERIFLVLVDDSDEMRVALHFACLRAKHTGGRLALLYVQEPADFQHWMAVEDLMREERREEAEARLQELSAEVQDWAGSMPMLYVREGDRGEELFKLVEEEPSISVVVLAASTESDSPGPVINYMLSRTTKQMRVPITIVPGLLSDEEIVLLT